MENFEFMNPVKVCFGAGTVSKIGEETKAYGSRAMIVTYKECDFFSELLETVHASLDAAGISYVDYKAITANPLLSQAAKGIEICKTEKVDVLIGLGGGSVMDCTKVIAAGVVYPHPLEKMIRFTHSEEFQIPPTESLPTLMIPTLPATASEMNPTAVITNDETRKKSYVWDYCLYPKVSILDPTLTLSLPAYQTACGGFDIIAHVIEAYLNGAPGENLDLQDRMQEGVVRCVLDTLPKVLEKPNDIQLRGVMMWSATVALNGWLSAGTFGFTPMHQMGHVLSARFNATHGATLACMMPTWMRYFADREDNARYVQLADRIFGCGLLEAADKFEALMRSCGVQTRISEFGVTKDDIDELTNCVVEVSFDPDGRLNGHPRMTREDIHALYELAL